MNRGNEITPFGVPEKSYPDFMSDAWWDLWNWFSEECGKRGIGLGLDDYVLASPGAGYWTDEVEGIGKKVGICMKKPFRLDIKDFVKEGENFIEILVYSTLANHYYTIPTPQVYKTSFSAGLVGPVKICYTINNQL